MWHLNNWDIFWDRQTDRQTLWFIGKLHYQKLIDKILTNLKTDSIKSGVIVDDISEHFMNFFNPPRYYFYYAAPNTFSNHKILLWLFLYIFCGHFTAFQKQGRSTSSGSVTAFSQILVVVFFHKHFHTLTGKLHMYMYIVYTNLRVTGKF